MFSKRNVSFLLMASALVCLLGLLVRAPQTSTFAQGATDAATSLATASASAGMVSKIVFSSIRNNKTNIYMMDVDGKNVHQLTTGKTAETRPALSPDGTHIAYLAAQSQDPKRQEQDVVVMDTGGTNQHTVHTTQKGQSCSSPTWAADSQHIMYLCFGAKPTFYSVNVDGSDEQPLFDLITVFAKGGFTNVGGSSGAFASVSPDGASLLIASSAQLPSTGSTPTSPSSMPRMTLWVVDLTTKHITPFFSDRTYDSDAITSAAWSPDGKQVAVITLNFSGALKYTLYVANADGSNVKTVMDSTKDGLTLGDVAWSPDGTQLALSASDTKHKVGGIYIMNTDGSNRTLISTGKGNNVDQYPSWGMVPSDVLSPTITLTPSRTPKP